MIESSAAGRAGTPDEVGTVGALLMGPDGGFITGSDILMDGGVTAAYWYGELAGVQTDERPKANNVLRAGQFRSRFTGRPRRGLRRRSPQLTGCSGCTA